MMHLSAYLSLAAVAAYSPVTAMLVPAGTESNQPDTDLVTWAKTHLHAIQTIKLDCATCPFALSTERDGRHEWTHNVASDLLMDFQSDGHSLLMNNVPFYPTRDLVGSQRLPPALHVPQRKQADEPSAMEGVDGDLRLSYSLEVNEIQVDGGNSVVDVVMTILALDGEMVKIDNVNVRAIKTQDGQLALASVFKVPRDPGSLDSKCENIMCRVYAKIISSVHRAKALAHGAAYKAKCLCTACIKCIQRMAGFPSQPSPHRIHHHHSSSSSSSSSGEAHRRPDGTVELPSHVKFLPGLHALHHGHMHHQGFLVRVARVMWYTVRMAVVPIFIGVVVGMAASAIGMLVGQLIVFCWMHYRRSETVVYEAVEGDEKDEMLPAYEEVIVVQEPEYRDEKEAGEQSA